MEDTQTLNGAGVVNMREYRFPCFSEYMKFILELPAETHAELRPDLLLVRVYVDQQPADPQK